MILPRIARWCWVLAMVAAPSLASGQADITHGPMLGRPSSTAMTIWARTSRPASFRVRYGQQPSQLDQHVDSPVTTLEHDNTGIVTLRELRPDTQYHYEVVGQENAALGGRFRTLPDSMALKDHRHNPRGLFNFAFEFACGNNQNPQDGAGPTLPTYDTLLRDVLDRVHFAILNGDWLYEEQRDFSVSHWRHANQVSEAETPRIVQIAPSITGLWQNYKLYLQRAPNLAKWHRNVPSLFTYDDHEALNDIYGTATTGFRDRRAVFRDIAVRGWFDYLAWSNPVQHRIGAHFGRAQLTRGSDLLEDRAADFSQLPLPQMANLHVHWGGPLAGVLKPEPDPRLADANHGVYQIVEVVDRHRLRISPPARASGESSYSIGRRTYGQFRVGNCEFFLLDTRSHRDLHDVSHPARTDVSMLGPAQLDWLMHATRESPADFLFIVSSVNFMVPHVGAGGGSDLNQVTAKDDAWTVFLHDRERLIEHLDELGKPAFILTGDLHNSFAIRITDRVWEFASGPHNSVNHRPHEDEGGRPANGRFQYGPRACEIRWSSFVLGDIPRDQRLYPHYCVVQVNNVFNNPQRLGQTRWVAFPRPHVIFQFYDGRTGELRYAETIHALKSGDGP